MLVRAISAEQKKLGRRIRELRGERGLSQEQLAERAGLHPKHMPRIEGGLANVTIATMVAISRALGISMDGLFAPTAKAS